MHEEGRHDDERVRWELPLAQRLRGDVAMSERPRRRVEAHRLGHHGARIRQARGVRGGGVRVAEHLVELIVERALHAGVSREKVPGPREGVGRRLVAGEEQRHHLVPELLVAHALSIALGVARIHEHREQVAGVVPLPLPLPRRTAFIDHAIDGGVETAACTVEADGPRRREVVQQLGEREDGDAELLEHRAQRVANVLRLALDVGAEQRLAGDRECEARHLRREIHARTIAPLAGHA